MNRKLSVGVIGDFDTNSPTHEATVGSLDHAASLLEVSVVVEWLPTQTLEHSASDFCTGFDTLWAAPGTVDSPKGMLEGIRFAREEKVPFIGTCGGFQHVVIEFARNVLGYTGASHAEYDPDSPDHFISALSCSPFGEKMEVEVTGGSLADNLYGSQHPEEEYRCNFGSTPERRQLLEQGGLHISGVDENGEPRILELPGNGFYIATLFVPQMKSSNDEPHPLVIGLLRAAMDTT